MEEIDNSLNQSMADIFEAKSPIAKQRDKLEDQLNRAKPLLKRIADGEHELISEFLDIFYTGSELKKQTKRLEKFNDNIQILTSLYSLITHRMDRLDQIKSEIEDIIHV